MDVELTVKSLISEQLPVNITITEDMELQNDLGIDSYGCVELLVKIEDELDITFLPSQLNIENLKKVRDFINIAKEAKR